MVSARESPTESVEVFGRLLYLPGRGQVLPAHRINALDGVVDLDHSHGLLSRRGDDLLGGLGRLRQGVETLSKTTKLKT